MEGKQYYKSLLEKYMEGSASKEEVNDLFEELSLNADSAEWESLITEITMAAASDPAYNKERWELFISKILREGEERKPVVRSISGYRRWWWAAASVILLIGVGSYFIFSHKVTKQVEVAKAIISTDVKAPATNRAMITLANGQKIYLDSTGNGKLATQNNTAIIKTADGKIEYSEASKGEGVGGEVYNTLTNPRGSKVIDMTLADGSHVWLNAGSSVTYPVTFIGNKRKVSISGEAYFEVTHNAAKPFTVSNGETTIQVLGTHFNVNAYDDEEGIRVTLLEGSVKVSNNSKNKMIKPGQQALIFSSTGGGREEDIKVQAADLEEVMAWKNGKFEFGEATDIPTIMRQIARWYDVDVEYKGTVKGHIGGTISREVNASQVFRMLEMTGVVDFRIEGKKVIVMQK
ncbi:MAG TPA: FecR domain-containing protein [Ginsengibacter sp.]